jgi:hypothetical protein
MVMSERAKYNGERDNFLWAALLLGGFVLFAAGLDVFEV